MLQNIGLVLASKHSMEFHERGGNDIITKYLQDYDWKIAATAFNILEKFTCQNVSSIELI